MKEVPSLNINSLSYRMLAGEICVVNGEFPDLSPCILKSAKIG